MTGQATPPVPMPALSMVERVADIVTSSTELDVREIARMLIDDEIFALAMEQSFLESERIKATFAVDAVKPLEKGQMHAVV